MCPYRDIKDQMSREWLEADGLGGYASGTVAGPRSRRYHALLLYARTPPTGRMVLVNGFEAWLEIPGKPPVYLTRQHYATDLTPQENRKVDIRDFTITPWPTWVLGLEGGLEARQEIFAVHESPMSVLRLQVPGAPEGSTLCVRLLHSGRDYHGLSRENGYYRFDADTCGPWLLFRGREDAPYTGVLASGTYHPEPEWYRNFLYAVEKDRGLDYVEDCASPGIFRFADPRKGATLVLKAGECPEDFTPNGGAEAMADKLAETERERRAAFADPLLRAADSYIVKRGKGKTIVAGYPWFTDWGRDTFISMRGLCIAGDRLADARQILTEWSHTVSEGMLPNRFPDLGDTPEYNSVDASLWFATAVHDYLAAAREKGWPVEPEEEQRYQEAILAILDGFSRGTRHRIRRDIDGLVACGEPGVQLTWMDAKVGNWVVTPRVGKPVEIQALWINALRIASEFAPEWKPLAEQATQSFLQRFWDEDRGCLFDVVDVNHVPGTEDTAIRPNMLFAVGGLPHQVLAGEQARQLVDLAEKRLWSPIGMRTLDPVNPNYRGRFRGGIVERDGAYHQGTAWGWLLGPFVEAWVRVRDNTPEARAEARERFLAPLLQHLPAAGVGHISEVTDGSEPYRPGGCPFQAWSLAELIRLDRQVLR